jgi:hypothetical protein
MTDIIEQIASIMKQHCYEKRNITFCANEILALTKEYWDDPEAIEADRAMTKALAITSDEAREYWTEKHVAAVDEVNAYPLGRDGNVYKVVKVYDVKQAIKEAE